MREQRPLAPTAAKRNNAANKSDVVKNPFASIVGENAYSARLISPPTVPNNLRDQAKTKSASAALGTAIISRERASSVSASLPTP